MRHRLTESGPCECCGAAAGEHCKHWPCDNGVCLPDAPPVNPWNLFPLWCLGADGALYRVLPDGKIGPAEFVRVK